MVPPIRVSGWECEFSVLVSNNRHLHEASDETCTRFLLYIKWRSKKEQESRQEHEDRWNSESYFPTKMILNINYGRQSNQDCNSRRGIVPAEEAFQDPFIFGVRFIVQLISTECYGAWPNPTSSNGHQCEGGK
ncbi:hypothetical protein OIU77_023801 [Salix suchowensis]|uniref:Uncharacterized protein n=1 Tax=Salix suchowensis TaxID=1278906 RepID=A0ABQ9C757_9ROSI|nr:hypothetical protein OIU77_023801 [Salix suchowensis]